MATNDDFGDYPKGRISLGAGDLNDVLDFTITYVDGEKIVNTLRRNAAGSTSGGRSCELAFKAAISHRGFERDYMRNYRKRIPQEFRLKVADDTFVIVGRLSSLSIVANVDNYIEFSAKVIGKDMKDSS